LPGANPKNTAGALWAALADFDETARKLRAAAIRGNGIETAISRAALARMPPPSFERRTLKGRPRGFDFPFSPCAEIHFAGALPAAFAAAAGTLLACNTLVEGAIEIAQFSADGKKKLAVLHETSRTRQIFHRWTNAARGPYRIRWTFNQSTYREAPVLVG